MKGTYVLLIKADKRKEIKTGSLGAIEFKPGFYAYVGSALNSLEGRINRHLSSGKKLFWHIDYLLKETEMIGIFRIESGKRLECRIAKKLSGKLISVPRFGSSDCRCSSHLFYSPVKKGVEKSIVEAFENIQK